ncbi:DUF2059 domain-containing protein [Ensifer soli]|uniref:DUF2059 domain-containing protein n=1 Tax=Ciceribacter sp. sgz301302 TaxID=3342379 RepID=UPI0035BB28C7
MTRFAGAGLSLAAAFAFLCGVSTAGAQDVNAEQLKAARATIGALGATNAFDNILPNLAARLKNALIQESPNFQDVITSAVDEKAIGLAPRRADLENEAAAIYAKTFTVEELNAIAAFYNSPAGKKLLNDGPIAARELLRAADIWAAGVSRDLNTEVTKALEPTVGAAVPTDAIAPGELVPKQ